MALQLLKKVWVCLQRMTPEYRRLEIENHKNAELALLLDGEKRHTEQLLGEAQRAAHD
jgi:hypothetical protein